MSRVSLSNKKQEARKDSKLFFFQTRFISEFEVDADDNYLFSHNHNTVNYSQVLILNV